MPVRLGLAPAMPGCGIWQSVRLEAFNKGCIRDVQIATIDCDKSNADIKISVQADKFSQKPYSVTINILDPAGNIIAQSELATYRQSKFNSNTN